MGLSNLLIIHTPLSKKSHLKPEVGGCQSYGPFLGTLNIRCRIIIGIQKGTIILTTIQVPKDRGASPGPTTPPTRETSRTMRSGDMGSRCDVLAPAVLQITGRRIFCTCSSSSKDRNNGNDSNSNSNNSNHSNNSTDRYNNNGSNNSNGAALEIQLHFEELARTAGIRS